MKMRSLSPLAAVALFFSMTDFTNAGTMDVPTYDKLAKLSVSARSKIIVALRDFVVKAEAAQNANGYLFGDGETKSLFIAVESVGWAADACTKDDQPCLFAGNFSCIKQRSSGRLSCTLGDLQGKCNAGEVACNASLFGTQDNGTPFCAKAANGATDECIAKGKKPEQLLANMKPDDRKAWDAYAKRVNEYCDHLNAVGSAINGDNCTKLKERIKTAIQPKAQGAVDGTGAPQNPNICKDAIFTLPDSETVKKVKVNVTKTGDDKCSFTVSSEPDSNNYYRWGYSAKDTSCVVDVSPKQGLRGDPDSSVKLHFDFSGSNNQCKARLVKTGENVGKVKKIPTKLYNHGDQEVEKCDVDFQQPALGDDHGKPVNYQTTCLIKVDKNSLQPTQLASNYRPWKVSTDKNKTNTDVITLDIVNNGRAGHLEIKNPCAEKDPDRCNLAYSEDLDGWQAAQTPQAAPAPVPVVPAAQ